MKIRHCENFLIHCVHEKTKFFVRPSSMSEVGYMAHRQKMLHIPAISQPKKESKRWSSA